MSARIYRLLRNNKEEGPFTSEELIQRNLKPYDLIWIDGRSMAWNYPGELPEFKRYTPLPGEDISQANKQPLATISPSVQAAIAVNNSITPAAIKQKPRYKVSAAWSKIQTVTTSAYKKTRDEQQSSPKKIIESKQPEGLQPRSLSWEEAWLDWEKEKIVPPSPEPKAKPAVDLSAKTANKNDAPVLETKYAEPLDSLKDKYIEHILQQKKNSNKSFSSGKISGFVVPSLALLVIFSIGYWLLHNTNVPVPASKPATVKPIQPEQTSIPSQPSPNANDHTPVGGTPSAINEEKQNITSTNKPSLTHAEDRKAKDTYTAKPVTTKPSGKAKKENKPTATLTLPGSNKIVQKATDKPVKQLSAPVITTIPEKNAVAETSTASTDNLNAGNSTGTTGVSNDHALQKETSVIKKKVKSGADYVSTPEYIEMRNGTASLGIRNISDINLDLVVVDLQYYDASNHFRKGETIYLHNLKAGKNVIVKTPKDINSLYATSKVSLVSADAENVYIVGDH